MRESNYSIYKLTFPNKKIYIGQTNQKPENRWKNGEGYHQQKTVYNAILKFGWDNIEKEILYTGLKKEEANCLEKELIAKYDTTNELVGYNTNKGGSGEKNLNLYSDISYDYLDLKKIIYYAYKTIQGKNGNVRSMLICLLFLALEKDSITVREICDYCNYSSETRYKESLEQLEKLKYITWNRYQNIILHPQNIIKNN